MTDEALTNLSQKLTRCSQQLSRVEELLSDLADELRQQVDGNGQTGNIHPVARPPRRRRKSPPIAPEALLLTMTSHTNGSVEVRINDGLPIHLTAMLADLLAVLADKQIGESDDHLVGWKSYETVRSALKQKTGSDINRKALHQNVFRLRQAFEKHGWPPTLIQTHPRYGIRFALKKTVPVDEFLAIAGGLWTEVIEGD